MLQRKKRNLNKTATKSSGDNGKSLMYVTTETQNPDTSIDTNCKIETEEKVEESKSNLFDFIRLGVFIVLFLVYISVYVILYK